MSRTIEEQKRSLIEAGRKAVDELIKVAQEKIIKEKGSMKDGEDEDPGLAADRLKNAAATKKVAIFDAFEILARIEMEENLLKEDGNAEKETKGGFAERRARRN
jgi:hypothetical protein